MNSFYFKGDKEDLNEILKDPVIKKNLEVSLRWSNFLFLQFISRAADEHKSYVMLKYGHLATEISYLIPDRRPVMFKDYTPRDLPSPEVLAKPRMFKP